MVDYIKYKIMTDKRWASRALQRLSQQQLQQNRRVMNDYDRLKNRGFDRQHKDELLDCYFNNKSLQPRLLKKLASFSQQIFRNLLYADGKERLYKIMNNDIEYLSRNNLRPQNYPKNIKKQDLTEKNKHVELQKIINIIKQNKLTNTKTFYMQAVKILNKIYKTCDMKILSTAINQKTYQNLQKIFKILQDNNWDFMKKDVINSLDNSTNPSSFLPMFWKFNIFDFVEEIKKEYSK